MASYSTCFETIGKSSLGELWMFIGMVLAGIQKSSLNWGCQICFSSIDMERGFVQTEFAPLLISCNSEFGWTAIALKSKWVGGLFCP